MKFLMALCALLLAVQAEAATVRYEFKVKVAEETFYTPEGWQQPGDFNNPGTQTVTYDNNPYDFFFKFSGIRDGQWHDAVIETNSSSSGGSSTFDLVAITTCTLGGIDCEASFGALYNGYHLSSPLLYGVFSAYLLDGGTINYSHQGYFNCGDTKECGGYDVTMAIQMPKTPLPAGGALLLTGLALIGFLRRSPDRPDPTP